MVKKIFFDMDGTIADLYGTDNWLELLLAETKGLFRNLKLMHNKSKLDKAINTLLEQGYQIEVITWTPKDVSEDYIRVVEQEKKEWIEEHFPMIREVHCVGYGVPKQSAGYKRAGLQILVDDNLDVLKQWETPKQRKTILADENLIGNLELLGTM